MVIFLVNIMSINSYDVILSFLIPLIFKNAKQTLQQVHLLFLKSTTNQLFATILLAQQNKFLNINLISQIIFLPCSVKLNNGGSSLPNNFAPGSLSLLKNLWAHAWRGVMRADGVYTKRRDTRSIASGEPLPLKIYKSNYEYTKM